MLAGLLGGCSADLIALVDRSFGALRRAQRVANNATIGPRFVCRNLNAPLAAEWGDYFCHGLLGDYRACGHSRE